MLGEANQHLVLTLIMLADYLGVFCYLLKEMLMVSVVSKVGEPCLRVVTPVHVNGIHTNEWHPYQ